MAKELPYFKFETQEWDNGNIQLCSLEAQGLFVNICSLYWSRTGELKEKLVLQKLCKGYEKAFKELVEEEIIAVINDCISIAFLDEQLSEFENVSNKRRDAANARWDKEKEISESNKNANAMQDISKSNAIREEKRREDNNTDSEKNQKSASVVFDWKSLVNEYNNLTGKKARLVPKGVKEKFKARIKDGYTKEDIWVAMVNCANDPYHKESNYKHFTLEFISRPDKLEKFLSIKK